MKHCKGYAQKDFDLICCNTLTFASGERKPMSTCHNQRMISFILSVSFNDADEYSDHIALASDK
jgi:hypothetical protein